MCGFVHTNSADPELIAPQEGAFMAPSITLGSDPHKTVPSTEENVHLLHGHHGGSTENREIPTIDLAADENDDLQKAIALSLQEQGGQQTPVASSYTGDDDFSKVLEVSLKTNCTRTTIDIINPNDRRRQLDAHVGLKNIGNSCWFNVVIQPLFHIPAFRNMIINQYAINISDVDQNLSHDKLVATLRKLFALLVGSDKKYVNPYDAVLMFQGHEMRKNAQQDVCEFVHKLLECLEEEYKLIIKNEKIVKGADKVEFCKESIFENPIMELFYGQSQKEINKEVGRPEQETFGQYPLTIKKYKDIHESILASMVGEVHGDDDEVVEIIQDTWFKMLPPVLIFSLSRYEFSKEKQRAEKVHNKFDFPEFLFMDRYMECNKDIIKLKHNEIGKMKQDLCSLYKSLEKYEKFGSGAGKYPLVDLLRYTLEFAEGETSAVRPRLEENSESQSCLSNMDVDSNEPNNDIEMKDIKDVSSVNQINLADVSVGTSSTSDCEKTNQFSSPLKKMKVASPAPRNISDEELSILKKCLPRWKNEVLTEVEYLRKSIEEIESQLRQIYEESSLQQVPYRLHAVIVHEGQAYGGHYWVYIFDDNKNCWIKFNDIQVTESSWQELLQDSVGGQNNASAYCLMYTDQSRRSKLFPDQVVGIDTSIYKLPPDLEEYVKSDNLYFMREISEWEIKQKQSDMEQRTVPAAAPNSPDIIYVDVDEDILFFVEIQTMLSQQLRVLFTNEEYLQPNSTKLIHKKVIDEINRIKAVADGPKVDAASPIMDFGIYLIVNEVKDIDRYLVWYAYEVLYHIAQSNAAGEGIDNIARDALHKLYMIREQYCHSSGEIFKGWKKLYRAYINCNWYFIFGFRKLHDEKECLGALPYFLNAYDVHRQLEENELQGPRKTMNFRVLSRCFHAALVSVNKRAITAFHNATTEGKCLEIEMSVTNLIVPALSYLSVSNLVTDKKVLKDITRSWCDLLDHGAGSAPFKSSLIERIIDQVLSGCSETLKTPTVRIQQSPTVLSLYKEYCDSTNQFLSQTSDL